MEFREVIRKRRSTRAYRADPVQKDKLEAILEAMNRAPSAGDLQAYSVVAVEDGTCRQLLAQAALGQSFVAQAPLVLVFFADPPRSARKYRERGRDLYALQDATIACSHAQLAAVAEGLATCWVGALEEEPVRRILSSQDHLIPVALLTVGHPAEDPEITPRRRLDDLVKRETF